MEKKDSNQEGKILSIPQQRIWGHDRTIEQLSTWWAKGIMPHGILLAGIKGIGKRSLIKQWIACVNGTSANDIEKITTGNTLKEYIETAKIQQIISRMEAGTLMQWQCIRADSQGSIKIEQIREVIENLYSKDPEDKKRFIIIENSEKMTEGASNALLKILEEPPQGVYFFLTTDSIGRIGNTIRSRIRVLTMHKLSKENMIHAMGIEMPKDSIQEKFIDGSIARAQWLLEANGKEIYAQYKAMDSKRPIYMIKEALEFASIYKNKSGIEDFISTAYIWKTILMYEAREKDADLKLIRNVLNEIQEAIQNVQEGRVEPAMQILPLLEKILKR